MAELPERTRRTQAERREETRAAILDAAVDCVAAEGYAAATTRRIAAWAGVTPGALQHHFASKAELLTEAVPRLGERLMNELLRPGLPEGDDPQALAAALLDRIWELHKSALVAAVWELYVAARHDPDLKARLAEAQRAVEQLTTTAAAAVFPEEAGADQAARLTTCLATLRGLAVAGYASEADRDAAWPATRAHLLALTGPRPAGEEPR
jgi:AcrR family transcriptional regulator